MPIFTSYNGELSSELDSYRKRGENEAAEHRPAGDSLQMDQNEIALQTDAEKWIGSEQRLFDVVMSEASRGVVDSGQKLVELGGRADQLLSDTTLLATIAADMSADRDALIALTENRMKAEVDWRHLRVSNGISAQAEYPDSTIWHFALIFVFALVETGVNTFFYENAEGLLGGFFVALLVSFASMGFAIALGYGFRYKNLQKMDSRIGGYCCLALFMLLAIYANAIFAAFRSEYQMIVDPDDYAQVRHGFAIAAAEAKKIFYLGMTFSDLMSFLLFGVGIILNLFGFYKGYTFDDKYPGHGSLDRKRKAARQVELAQQEILRQKVKDFLHHRKAEVQATLHDPAQIINLASRRASDLQIAKSMLQNQAQAVQRDFTLVLNAYRNANIAIRASKPPEYFKLIPDLVVRADASQAEPLLRQLAEVQASVKAWRDHCQEALNAKMQSLHSDSATILNQTFSAFLREVENDAQERIDRSVATMHRQSAGMSNA